VLIDRCHQARVKNALEPEWEARFEPCSYGFRPGRGCHDAIESLFNTLRGKSRRVWILDADLAAAFDDVACSSARRGKLLVPGADPGQQVLPRGSERGRPLALQFACQAADLDAGRGEGGDDLVGVTAVGGQERTDLAVVGEGLQSLVRHGVDGERCDQVGHVQHVRGVGVLGGGRGPQQPLRPGALVGQPLPPRGVQQLAVGPVGSSGHGDTEPVPQFCGRTPGHGLVPPGNEHRGDRAHDGVLPGHDPPLHAAQVGSAASW
jgi:hypothetical protein